MDSMVVQHLDLYDWGTSNPIYSSLVSGFVQSRSTRGPSITGVGTNTPRTDATVGGVFDTSATDQRVLTEINCGEGSYLERVSELVLLVPLDELCMQVVRRHVCVNDARLVWDVRPWTFAISVSEECKPPLLPNSALSKEPLYAGVAFRTMNA